MVPGGLFPKLTSVNICASYGWEPQAANAIQFHAASLVQLFATLPSVRIINAVNIGSPVEPLELNVPTLSSNVTDFNIAEGDVSPACLTLLLQSFEGLQSFSYRAMDGIGGKHGFDPFSIVTSLSACAQHSLRELQIRSASLLYEVPYMGHLRKFRALEYLDTDIGALFEDFSGGKQTFESSLPEFIKEIKLHGARHPLCDLWALLTDLGNSKDYFLNLRSIEIFDTRMPFGDAETRLQNVISLIKFFFTWPEKVRDRPPTFTRHRGHYAQRQAKKALIQGQGL